MPGIVDSYQVAAKYYDGAYGAMKDLVNAPFYLNLAKKFGGPVLEIGCGTGRVLLPMAREGIEIHGGDNSGPMMGMLKEGLARENRSFEQGHASFWRHARFPAGSKISANDNSLPADAANVYGGGSIGGAEVGCSPLADSGTLAFDAFFPRFDRVPLGIGEERMEAQWVSPTDAEILFRRFVRKEADDKVNQTYTVTFIFRSFRNGELILEETDTLKMSYYTYPHLRALFLLANLEVVEEYGSFEKTPLDNSDVEMIFLLRKK